MVKETFNQLQEAQRVHIQDKTEEKYTKTYINQTNKD